MRSETGMLYLEASGDGQIEKVMGDFSWLPFSLQPYESNLADALPALVGAQAVGKMELDFVEILPEVFADIQYHFDEGRQFVWLRNSSRHAAHLRAAQQVANGRALREAVASRWLDDIHRANSHLRTVLDAVPVPVAYWHLSGKLLFANKRFEALIDTPPQTRAAEVLHATDVRLGTMQVPLDAWTQATILTGPGLISFVRDQLSNSAKSQLIVDLTPTGEVAGLLDITEFIHSH